MPIYEYRCSTCEERFEALVARSDLPPPPCPRCGALRVARLLSTFAVGKTAAGPVASPCGSPRCACRSPYDE
ncbi:MAG: zinc ribbon domain-containing protein [Candidatus Eisenbacteria bacterium]|uniref:Zinc ribbon domain-containing protein n=1 Tax=Eiseniibacteriota bacterium TaxID=2212470 RepID=A0A538TCK8_UNCEI|nr:MAG: zinc ribbon domain-containing protein [Candidatus Eisenbacteria bacterium]